MNKNRKLVAFAERGDRPHVVVFDLELRRRRKVLRCAEFVSQEVISLAFSHDSKYLLAQGNLSRGIDNCFLCSSIGVKVIRRPWTAVLVTIFLYLNFI